MSQRTLVVGSGWLKLKVSTDLPDDLMRAAAAKAVAPFSKSTGQSAIRAMRAGTGGAHDQFMAQREETLTGNAAWKKTKPFGNLPAPARTLHRTGKLQAAWEGGAGSSESQSDTKIGIGAEGIPYAGIFQRTEPVNWHANPKHRSDDGRLRAFWKLGLTFGVWVSEEKLLMGWPIMPRRIGAGKRMRVSVANVVITDLIALATGRPLPSASRRSTS